MTSAFRMSKQEVACRCCGVPAIWTLTIAVADPELSKLSCAVRLCRQCGLVFVDRLIEQGYIGTPMLGETLEKTKEDFRRKAEKAAKEAEEAEQLDRAARYFSGGKS